MQDNDTSLIETFNTSRQQQEHLWQQAHVTDSRPSTASSASASASTRVRSSSTVRVDDSGDEFQRLHDEHQRIESKMKRLKRKNQKEQNLDSIRKRQRLFESYQAHPLHPKLRIGATPRIDIYKPIDWKSLKKEIFFSLVC